MIASREGDQEIVDLLIKSNAEINMKTKKGCTSIQTGIYILCITIIFIKYRIEASYNGNKEIVLKLLKHSALVNIKDKDGFTPLYSGYY